MMRFLSVLALGLGAFSAASGGTPYSVPSDSSVEITLQCWLQHCPPIGMMEVQARVLNRTGVLQSWEVSSTDSSYTGGTMTAQYKLDTPAESGIQQRLLLPVAALPEGSRYYKNINTIIVGPGVRGVGTFRLNTPTWSSSTSGSTTRLPFFSMSESLGREFPSLPGLLEEGNVRLCAHTLGDAPNAPADWRGYAGLSQWWLTAQEWEQQSAEQKNAALDWTALGGRLVIYSDQQTTPPAPFQSARQWKVDHGLGQVKFLSGKDSVPKEGKSYILDHQAKTTEYLLGSMDNAAWRLAEIVGPVQLRGLLIFGFILIFAVVVGPLNLFVFASAKNRPRLFWTTPLISLAGSALLALLMIVQDGFGGTGARTTLAVLLPEDKKMAVVQEQVARTGILWSGSFAKTSGVWMMPLSIPEPQSSSSSSYSRRRYSARVKQTQNCVENETQAWGGWFSSRSLQAHLLQGIKLNRGGIEFTAGSQPSIISRLGAPLSRIYLMDAQGGTWMAENVSVGVRTSLKKLSKPDFNDWFAKNFLHFSTPLVKERARSCVQDGTWFFAEVAEPAKFAIPTLDSIVWAHDRAFVTGPYSLVGASTAGKQAAPGETPAN